MADPERPIIHVLLIRANNKVNGFDTEVVDLLEVEDKCAEGWIAVMFDPFDWAAFQRWHDRRKADEAKQT